MTLNEKIKYHMKSLKAWLNFSLKESVISSKGVELPKAELLKVTAAFKQLHLLISSLKVLALIKVTINFN